MATKKMDYEIKGISWIDRFYDWLETKWFGGWLFFLTAYLVGISVHHFLLWTSGHLAFGEFSEQLLLSVYFWGALQGVAFYYLRRAARTSIIEFRQALDISEAGFIKIARDFITVSPGFALWGTIISVVLTLVMLLQGVLDILSPLFSATLLTSTWSAIMLAGFVPFATGFFYFVFRTLFAVNKIYDQVKKINLFNLEPLYGLSRFTSKVGIVFIIYLLLNFLTANAWGSELTGEAIALFYLFLNSSSAVLAFVLPLVEIHNRLAKEKVRVSEENNRRLDDSFWKLQQNIDQGKLDDISQQRTAISALMDFRNELKRISTWPWDPATLRGFLTALFVPLTVWSIQQVINRLIN